MKEYLRQQILVLILLILPLSLFACSSIQEQEDIESLTIDDEADDRAAEDGFVVVFYGESCDMDVPDKLPVGEYHFTLDNQSPLVQASLFVAKITGDHEYQELIDLQPSYGAHYDKPDWLIYAKKIGTVDSKTGQRKYDITFETGEYAIYVYGHLESGKQWMWFCRPITIVKTPDG